MTAPVLRRWLAAAVLLGLSACITKDDAKQAIQALAQSRGETPDQLPVMQNSVLPFKYPHALYAQKVQGNVVLRLFIDSTGALRPESTRVEESSTYPALDSAALTGSRALLFTPAKIRGRPVPVSIKFPVFFRHPQAPPPPGDSILRPKTR